MKKFTKFPLILIFLSLGAIWTFGQNGLQRGGKEIKGEKMVSKALSCAATGKQQVYEWITEVMLDGNTNQTGNDNGYGDYTNNLIDVSPGTSLNFSLSSNTQIYPECWRIWIDYNGDGDFNNSNEEVFGIQKIGDATGNISIPSNATGQRILRVAMRYRSIPTSCDAFDYGEVEDYMLNFGGSEGNVFANANGPYGGIVDIPIAFSSEGSIDLDGTITEYLWNFGDGTTSTLPNPTHTYNSIDEYNVSLKVTDNEGFTNTDNTTATITDGNYCPIEFANQGYEWIAGVQIGEFTNNSGSENGGYSDFTSHTIDLVEGNNSLTLTPNSDQYTEHWTIWIDYNKNANFNDSGELVFSGSAKGNTVGAINVLSSASGETRMRIAMQYNASADDPCGTYTNGEAEDYTVSFGEAITYSITTNTVGQGTISLSPTGGTYPENTVVSVTAIADPGWTFTGWSGALSGTINPDNVTMDGDKTVTANFGELPNQNPVANANGPYIGTLDTPILFSSAGSDDLEGSITYLWDFGDGSTSVQANPSHTYNSADIFNVSLTVTDIERATDTDNTTATVSIGELCEIVFTDQSYEWIAGVQIGSFINNSGKENGGYSDFTSQTIDLVEGNNNLTLTPNSDGYTEHWAIWIDYNGDADFNDSGELAFTGSANGNVDGAINVPPTASGIKRMRIAMQYNASPTDPCGSYSYGEAEDYTVSFGILPTYRLTTNTVGQGTISSSPAGGIYSENTVVSVTANADPGWTFTGWSDALSGTVNPDNVTMDSDKTVTANFALTNNYSLTTNIVGQGNISLSPTGGSYPENTIVTVTANADPGWTFTGWSGALNGTNISQDVTMDSDKAVTANFEFVINEEPVANANGSYNGNVGVPILFSSAGSSDLEGSITYLWDFGDGSTSVQANPSHTYDSVDIFNVTLTVTDNQEAQDTDNTTATIEAIIDLEYCSATGNATGFEHITRVQFGNIDISSGMQGYADNTETASTTLIIGQPTSLEITTSENYSSDEMKVYIDYNYDGDFLDANEEVYHFTDASEQKTYIVNVNAPASAEVNRQLRMRIILWDAYYTSDDPPCGTFEYGEVEDYSIYVASGSGPIALKSDNYIKVSPNPAKDLIKIFTSDENATIEIHNSNGVRVLSKKINGTYEIIDISDLPSGIYFIFDDKRNFAKLIIE